MAPHVRASRPVFSVVDAFDGSRQIFVDTSIAANAGIKIPVIKLAPNFNYESHLINSLEEYYYNTSPAEANGLIANLSKYADNGWDFYLQMGSAAGSAKAAWSYVNAAAGNYGILKRANAPEAIITFNQSSANNLESSSLDDFIFGRFAHETADPATHVVTVDPVTGKQYAPIINTGHPNIDLVDTINITPALILTDKSYMDEIHDSWIAGKDFPNAYSTINSGHDIPANLTEAQYQDLASQIIAKAYQDFRARRLTPLKAEGRDIGSVYEIIMLRRAERALSIIEAGGVGSAAGSALGQYLAGGNAAKGIVYSSLLGEVGERLATALVAGPAGDGNLSLATTQGLQAFGNEVAVRAGQAAVGAVSSWLSMELGEALGLKGFGAELFTTAGSYVTAKIVGNLLDATLGSTKIFNGFVTQVTGGGVKTTSGPGFAGAIGSFFGAKLGAMVVSPQTQAGVALSSIGSAIGSYLAYAEWGKVLGNFFAPGIGAFVGFVLGALIGNLFGKKKPKVPTASAETVLQIPYARYELGTITVANNGNRELVTSMATTARDTLNGLIAMVAYTNTTAYVSNLNGYSTTQAYGHDKNQATGQNEIYATINGVKRYFSSADHAVEFGTLTAIRNTKIVGGDIFAKRAIARSPAADLTSLTGDLQIASDYRYYAGNRALVNGFIIDAYATLTEAEQSYYASNKALIDKVQAKGTAALTSGELSTYNGAKPTIDKIIGALESQATANPWIITLQRVSELGLDKWTASDFYGGLQGFLSSFDLAGHGTAFENGNFQWNGADFTVSVAGGTEGVLSLLASASADGRSATINGLDKIGYTWVNAGAATSGADYMEYRWNGGGVTLDDNHTEIQTTYEYYWNGWDYDVVETQTPVTVDGGDDIFVGSQYNDVLAGRSGWDWLDGQGGDDTLYGGDQNDTLIGGAGNDSLFGEGGDDYLAAGDGADGVYGGAGNDILADGQGSECLLGEDGDDTFLIAADATFNWFWGGTQDPNSDPNGKDTISAERLSVGVSFDLDFRPADWNGHPDVVAGNPISRQAFVTNAATGAWITSEGLLGVENGTGSNFNDRLYGTVGANVLKGLAGDDYIWGRNGNDTIEGGAGADSMAGEGDYDWLSYAGSSAGVYVDLSTGEAFGGDAEGDLFSGFEAVRGSKLADQLKGYDGGDNWLDGGGGDDWLVATTGADVYVGGEGKDFVDYSAATAGVTLNLGGYTPTGQTTGAGYGGLAANQSYIGVEGVVGSAYGDSLSAGEGDQTFIGGAGADYLAGAAGADTYVINRGDGYDTVTEDNTGWNVLSFGENVKFSDLWFGTAGGANGWLDVGVRGDSAQFRVSANFANLNSSKIKTVDLNGAGQLDVDGIEYAPAASDNSEAVNGWSGRRDLIVAYNGDDSITGSGGAWEDKGNVVVGGLGNDVITTSGGDDQFAYDRGDGLDSINDAGGEDTLVFGSTVAAEDVIYQVVGDHLYIGAKNPADPNQTAYYTPDHVQIWNGGIKYVVKDGYTDQVLYETLNTVEYVIAGGTSIDLRKLDIAWTEQVSYNYDNYYPIALDLDGDGLNLSAVDSSQVVVKTAQGGISQIGWVGPTDGFLAVDRDGDGAINRLSEISFVQDKPGATSDLEGLRTWDSNGDGVLDKADKDFGRILLFVDANQNGRSTARELRTLEQAGIKAINLGGTATGYTRDMTIDSFVQNTISFVWADGRTGEGYDVALARRVLGSEGLYAGAYQAEWGARDEDGTLGRLANDPKTAAKAARIAARKGLLDKLGASYDEVKAAAQLDFSDTDKVDASVARRWKKMDASQRAAWLSGQASGMDGQSNLAALKAISSGQALANALSDSAQAGQDLIARGLAQAGAQVSASDPGAPGGGGPAASDGLGVDFGAASGLVSGLGGGLAASQPLDGVVAASGAIGQDRAWWRGETDGGLAGAGSLAGLLAAMDQGVGADAAAARDPGADPALLQQQMLLRQAMAGFGGQAGGSAAVWNRDAVQASAVLAAAGQATSPSALNLALAS